MGTSDKHIKVATVPLAEPRPVPSTRPSTFSEKLAVAAAALGLGPVKPPGPIQVLYNRFKKHLKDRIVTTPLPEEVHLRAENFPYWVKLEYLNPAQPGTWISATASIVIPLLEEGIFDETGFRIDPWRAGSIFDIITFLSKPNCIHRNLRNHRHRGEGGIKGEHMYVAYFRGQTRKVAFTGYDPRLGKVILVSSFNVSRIWASECAEMPAVHVAPTRNCTCK
jgi:hypothetical protein